VGDDRAVDDIPIEARRQRTRFAHNRAAREIVAVAARAIAGAFLASASETDASTFNTAGPRTQ
jgi:hypothetical protein